LYIVFIRNKKINIFTYQVVSRACNRSLYQEFESITFWWENWLRVCYVRPSFNQLSSCSSFHPYFFCNLLEQNVFNIATLSFDDNKVLKVQLDMLIFVQVRRIKGYNFISLKTRHWLWKNNWEQKIFQGKLCCKSEFEGIRV